MKIVVDFRCALHVLIHTCLLLYGTTQDTITALPSAAASAPPPVSPSLGRRSVNHVCQFCGHTGPTYVKEKLGNCAIIGIVVLVVCFWPLFWLPLVMGSCKDKQHICTNCQREVSLCILYDYAFLESTSRPRIDYAHSSFASGLT